MERDIAWKSLTDEQNNELKTVTDQYRTFISECKTERLCTRRAVEMAEAAGYKELTALRNGAATLKTGDKIYATNAGKAIMLVQLGEDSLESGMNILGAHIDSPRLDIKQNPVYESHDFAFLDTHYYGGIKAYQWVTMPLALYGVVALKDGSVVDIALGDGADDPVLVITDLLPHLGAEQMKKTGDSLIEGEALDILVGSKPLIVEADKAEEAYKAEEAEKAAGTVGVDAAALEKKAKADGATYVDKLNAMSLKEAVKARLLSILHETYGIEEEDFLSAELEVVPAGAARDCGLDRSMVVGYGQDDRVCAFTSLLAQLDVEAPKRTSVTILVDKEEIGSVGATGMTSVFFENTIAEIMDMAGETGNLALRHALANSCMLSSDVSAAFDPAYPSVFETKNTAFAGRGLVFNKFTGARGKSGSNDANAEYIAKLRRIMDDAGVKYQTAELGRVNAGGGGTIAYIPAKYGMDVIDSGVAVLSMHSPWEVTSKVDIYEAYLGYKAFLRAE